ncbi:MAG: tyrosine--tRNA ligase [Actinomycetes bacterium]
MSWQIAQQAVRFDSYRGRTRSPLYAAAGEFGSSTMNGAALLADLGARGLLHDTTDADALVQRLDAAPTPAYCGFDPTADSLHIGNLQSIMLLRRLQRAGHPPIALVGGATGMIGDPSGRTDERQFLDQDVLDANRASIGEQLRGLLDFDDGPHAARLVDNRTWTEPMGVLEFLRDVGKHVTVNTMLAKESVKGRIERESGISFTEFSYMLLQANDYFALHRDHGCDLQVAGSDQWGNITAGIDLIRRRTGDTVHGLTAPLITRADGTKFGKSEGANVWLSAERTSPYQLYQYFVGVADADVEPMLLRLTAVDVAECRSVADAHHAQPGRRDGQRRLARELLTLIHGPDVVDPVERAAGVLFGGPLDDVDRPTFELLAAEIPTTTLQRDAVIGADPLDSFASSGLAKSKGEVRKNLAGHYVNGVSLAERSAVPFAESDLLHGQFVVLRRGKTSYHLLDVR